MVIARSRLHVVWYTQALRTAAAAHPPLRDLLESAGEAPQSAVYGAFSGAVEVDAPEAAACDAEDLSGGAGTSNGGSEGVRGRRRAAVGRAAPTRRASRLSTAWSNALKFMDERAAGQEGGEDDGSASCSSSDDDSSSSGSSGGGGSGDDLAVVECGSGDRGLGDRSTSGTEGCAASGAQRNSIEQDAPDAVGGQQNCSVNYSASAKALVSSALSIPSNSGRGTCETSTGDGGTNKAASGGHAATSNNGKPSDCSSDAEDDVPLLKRARLSGPLARVASTLSAAAPMPAPATRAASAEATAIAIHGFAASQRVTDAAGASGAVTGRQASGAAAGLPSASRLVAVSEAELNVGGVPPGIARLLVVCSKYETGYDDPRLGAMFVDRAMSGKTPPAGAALWLARVLISLHDSHYGSVAQKQGTCACMRLRISQHTTWSQLKQPLPQKYGNGCCHGA